MEAVAFGRGFATYSSTAASSAVLSLTHWAASHRLLSTLSNTSACRREEQLAEDLHEGDGVRGSGTREMTEKAKASHAQAA